jgi:hypothetical protein
LIFPSTTKLGENIKFQKNKNNFFFIPDLGGDLGPSRSPHPVRLCTKAASFPSWCTKQGQGKKKRRLGLTK